MAKGIDYKASVIITEYILRVSIRKKKRIDLVALLLINCLLQVSTTWKKDSCSRAWHSMGKAKSTTC